MAATDEQLVRAFHSAAIFLINRIQHDGWYWSTNYLREHVRTVTGLRFTNSRSPGILRMLVLQHPELKAWIELKPLTRPSADMLAYSTRKKRTEHVI
jgi:hypothetical protein